MPGESPRVWLDTGSTPASGWGGTAAWLLGYRRIGVRNERRADLLQEWLHLACALTCLHFLAFANE